METVTKEYVQKFGEFDEGLDYWNTDLYESPDKSVTKNVGLKIAWIMKYAITVNEIEKTIFTVETETIGEIVNWNKGEQKVLNELVENPTYPTGEFDIIEVFETLKDANEYAKKHFPKKDLRQLIKSHYE